MSEYEVTDRRAARERALGFLYEAETRSCSVQEVLDAQPLDVDEFAADLAAGTEANLDDIDELLNDHSRGWPVERMPAMDRAILRMATYELAQRLDVPTAVVLNEAVDLAKQYSTEKSGAFVNGLLVAAADELRPSDN